MPLEHVHVVSTDTSEGTKATVKQEESDTPQPVSEHPGIMVYHISVCNGAYFVHLTRNDGRSRRGERRDDCSRTLSDW